MKRILVSVLVLLVIFGGIAAAVLLRLSPYLIVSFLCFTAVFFMVALWALFKDYTEAIRKAAEFADRVAGGDLSARIYLKADEELGMLSESLNRMAAGLGLMLAELRSAAAELAEAASFPLPESQDPSVLTAALGTVGNGSDAAAEEAETLGRTSEDLRRRAEAMIASLAELATVSRHLLEADEALANLSAFTARVAEKARLAGLNASFAPAPEVPENLRLAAEQTAEAVLTFRGLLQERIEALRNLASRTEEVSAEAGLLRDGLAEAAATAARLEAALAGHRVRLAGLEEEVRRFAAEAEGRAEAIERLAERTAAFSRKAEHIRGVIARFRTGEEP